LTLRDAEPEGDRLGLRLEIVSNPGEDFKYDLSFDVVTKAAFSDEVRTHARAEFGSLKVIIPAAAMDLLEGRRSTTPPPRVSSSATPTSRRHRRSRV